MPVGIRSWLGMIETINPSPDMSLRALLLTMPSSQSIIHRPICCIIVQLAAFSLFAILSVCIGMCQKPNSRMFSSIPQLVMHQPDHNKSLVEALLCNQVVSHKHSTTMYRAWVSFGAGCYANLGEVCLILELSQKVVKPMLHKVCSHTFWCTTYTHTSGVHVRMLEPQKQHTSQGLMAYSSAW